MTTETPQRFEATLSPLATGWLERRGFEVYAEVPLYSRWIDLVGVRWEDEAIIAIELKLSLSRKAIGQAHINQLITQQSYVGIRTTPISSSIELAGRCGVGVVRFAQPLQVILEPDSSGKLINRLLRDGILHYCRLQQPGGVAGLPGRPGPGPAQRCHADVIKYVAGNPEATWRTIYLNVPNHYCHAGSMRSCLQKLELWKTVYDRIGPRPFGRDPTPPPERRPSPGALRIRAETAQPRTEAPR